LRAKNWDRVDSLAFYFPFFQLQNNRSKKEFQAKKSLIFLCQNFVQQLFFSTQQQKRSTRIRLCVYTETDGKIHPKTQHLQRFKSFMKRVKKGEK